MNHNVIDEVDLARVRPLFNRVVIRIATPAEKTAAGVFIPDTGVKPQEGRVVAVGELCKAVKVGDHVVYGKYTGTDFHVGGVPSASPKVWVCEETEVLAVIDPPRKPGEVEIRSCKCANREHEIECEGAGLRGELSQVTREAIEAGRRGE